MSALTSDEVLEQGLFHFEGVDELKSSWREGLRPDPFMTVSGWADQHRMLAARASAEPDRYRTSRTPYMREIMDALSPGSPVQRVVFMKAAQVGATEAGNNWIGFIIHQAPGPMLAVQPTVELAKRNSRHRIDPLIEESPALRDRVKPARSRDAGNTMLSKEFNGGILIMTGANSAVGLRSTPARYIFLDEVDAYPASADDEGDPVTLAEARSLTFSHRRKVFLASTPTIRGLSRIEREYEASDQRRYHIPCPECGVMQWLKFERLRWDKGKPETVCYHCEACDVTIGEHSKTAMLQEGEWRASAIATDPATAGFHLSALYSPAGWLSWQAIARAFEAAQGSDESLKAATPFSARPGSRPARRRIGSACMTGASDGKRAAFLPAACSSPPGPTSRRIASRSTSGHGAVVWKAGWSSISCWTAVLETKPAGRRSTRCSAAAGKARPARRCGSCG